MSQFEVMILMSVRISVKNIDSLMINLNAREVSKLNIFSNLPKRKMKCTRPLSKMLNRNTSTLECSGECRGCCWGQDD